MAESSCFRHDFASARAAFLEAASGATGLRSFTHPLAGPAGEQLATDVAVFGDRASEYWLVLLSGTHGLEGLAGSACQLSWMQTFNEAALPTNTSVLLIHLINPWGCAWGRRQTEDNVDLNRNFVDFAAPLPTNVLYASVQQDIVQGFARCSNRAELHALFARLRERLGDAALRSALMQGQYAHADGIGFGGSTATWSRRTSEIIACEFLLHARKVSLVDFHTGHGPYGYGSVFTTKSLGTLAFEQLFACYGENLNTVGSGSGALAYPIVGDTYGGWERCLTASEVLAVALEFGTFSLEGLVRLQFEDCWAHQTGNADSLSCNEIRRELWRFFYPASEDWFEALLFRSGQVIDMALRDLERSRAANAGFTGIRAK